MKAEHTHHKINWVDGMKINKNHFIGMENAMMSALHNSNANNVTPVNFGLLPSSSLAQNSIDLVMSMDGQSTIHVEVNTCRAITLGGFEINITEHTKTLLEQSGQILKHQYDLDTNDQEWFIVLYVNPFNKIPVGDADPQEDPPRHPFVLSDYKIDIIPKNESSDNEMGLYHITIGKVEMVGDTPTLVEDFIPPCRSIQSHPDLKFTYSEIGAFLNQMEHFSMHIVQKIYQKKQTNDLAHMVLHLAQKTGEYLNSIIPEFRLKDKYEAPVAMLTKLVSLSRVIKSALDVYVGTGKEELLNYLTDWCDLNQGAFENVLIEMIELDYVHTNINESLYKTSAFTRLMLSLYKKLNELDYIGKKSDSNIFVKEEVVDNTEVKSRRSFLLD
ncbi:hypothetical protein DZC78_04025 [Olleya aquimaris]|uniref:Type VI secretion system baseplate subunit TssK n=1 Tax=Olleya sediminilitoris TaxID=2795739 RepID=A0ABS1WHN6_9FLAO|nr:hypothetical protein [Olleya sediminilitoris]AXO79592.1 hypothetical protein DZC78_04025 [Olleya aquimaris]MBL7558640.1 hypothetical protein [Olleya sediminilitoris]